MPGVNVVCAATFLAAIGDIRRFRTSRQLVAYLGLDPKVRQSGSEPARLGPDLQAGVLAGAMGAGRSDPQRDPAARAVARVSPADPRSPRLPKIATVAAARKLACLFWCLLTRDENYAHAQPSLTAKKLRKLELIAGAKRFDGSAAGIWSANRAMREAEKQLARQAEASYVRMVRDWQAAAPKKVGASATPERA